jgi:hypothetical protein
MKRLVCLLGGLLSASALYGANPAFTDFLSQFTTNGNKIALTNGVTVTNLHDTGTIRAQNVTVTNDVNVGLGGGGNINLTSVAQSESLGIGTGLAGGNTMFQAWQDGTNSFITFGDQTGSSFNFSLGGLTSPGGGTKFLSIRDNGGVSMPFTLSVTGALTNGALSASTLVSAGATKVLTSVANAAGVLTNDGSGGFGFTTNLSSMGAASGTGTNNYIAKWTGTNTLGNSGITDDGTGLFTINSGASGASQLLRPGDNTNGFPKGIVLGHGTGLGAMQVTVKGAPGEDGTGAVGQVNIVGGANPSGVFSAGGDVQINGGTGSVGGGSVYLEAGAGSGGGFGGAINFSPGNGTPKGDTIFNKAGFGGVAATISGTSGEVTINSLTADTLTKANASKALTSIANAAGILTNDGAGGFGFTTNITQDITINNFNTTNLSVQNNVTTSNLFYISGKGNTLIITNSIEHGVTATDWDWVRRDIVLRLAGAWEGPGDTIQASGTATAIAAAAGLPQLEDYATSSAANTLASFAGSAAIAPWNKQLRIRIWAKFEQLTACHYWVGWSSLTFGNAWATNEFPHTVGSAQFAGYRFSPTRSGDTTVVVVTSNGSASTTNATPAIAATTNLTCFEIELNTASNANFYVNGVMVLSNVSATLPAQNQNGNYGASVCNDTAGATRSIRGMRLMSFQKILP